MSWARKLIQVRNNIYHRQHFNLDALRERTFPNQPGGLQPDVLISLGKQGLRTVAEIRAAATAEGKIGRLTNPYYLAQYPPTSLEINAISQLQRSPQTRGNWREGMKQIFDDKNESQKAKKRLLKARKSHEEHCRGFSKTECVLNADTFEKADNVYKAFDSLVSRARREGALMPGILKENDCCGVLFQKPPKMISVVDLVLRSENVSQLSHLGYAVVKKWIAKLTLNVSTSSKTMMIAALQNAPNVIDPTHSPVPMAYLKDSENCERLIAVDCKLKCKGSACATCVAAVKKRVRIFTTSLGSTSISPKATNTNLQRRDPTALVDKLKRVTKASKVSVQTVRRMRKRIDKLVKKGADCIIVKESKLEAMIAPMIAMVSLQPNLEPRTSEDQPTLLDKEFPPVRVWVCAVSVSLSLNLFLSVSLSLFLCLCYISLAVWVLCVCGFLCVSGSDFMQVHFLSNLYI